MRTQTDNFVDAMFVWNHANTDGMGAKIFQRTLFNNLASPPSTSPLVAGSRVMTTAISRETFPQPQEKLAKHKVTLGYACSEIWHSFGPSAMNSMVSKAHWAPVRPEPYITRNKSFDIDGVTLKKLLGLCRENGTTLTGLFHGIVLACLSVDLNEGRANAFNAATAIDQRRFMRKEIRPSKYASLQPEKSVQNCVASVYHTFERDIVSDIRAQARINNWTQQPIADLEPSIWKAANIIRGDIDHRINIGLTNSIVGMMKLITDWQDYHRSTEKKPRELSWIVTNIGVIDGKPEKSADSEDGWAVNKARFTLCADVAGPAMQISTVSVKGGDLTVELSWQDLDDLNDVGNRLTHDLEAWLIHLAA
ncbi:hypothetical protein F53441_2662 [Fusarium austroafricanum]|uniref:Uncharacterized protein n=1 Tax=Fusarium austroafricanum TaxID=2364996 RepID=A0A8H4P2P3_9HYPO|nr:hypothetical protein F53441_2662 [Fusarium austroafricanum]